MKKTLAVISHTHWDREWYLPFEKFRIKLVDLIDRLLIILKKYPEYRFHLDAQTVVLEDYLELRPANKALLKKYVKEGRILIGPWYVQNDFNLTSGEATVRNLIIGQSIADEYGSCMRIGYAADQFGLISQLPQIFTQMGMDSCIFGRGANLPETPPQLYWEGADKSVIYCEFMKWWYNNLQRLPADPDEACKLIKKKVSEMEPFMQTNNYLLMNGVDHLEAQEDLFPIFEAVRDKLSEDCEIKQDIFTDFVKRSQKFIKDNNIELNKLYGELRYGGESKVLTGTLSSRVYLKQANSAAQTALEKYVEPLYAMLDSKGAEDYPKDHLNYLWKTLIKNHPHDSICGCSVDAVHRHMMDRYERIKENTDELIRRGMQSISDHADRKAFRDTDYTLTVFSPVPYSGSYTVNTEIMIPEKDGVKNFTLIRANGKPIPFSVTYAKRGGYSSITPINLPGDVTVIRYGVRFTLPFSGAGYEILTVRPCEGEVTVANENAAPTYMENEYLRCEINGNGTVSVTDKATGKLYHGLFALEDTEEAGDEYVHLESEDAETFTSHGCKAEIRVIEQNAHCQSREIKYDFKIRRDGEKTIPVTALLTLTAESKTLDVRLRFTNTAKDHRLRVLIPTYIKTDETYAAIPYDCTKRKISTVEEYRRQPNNGYVAVSDGKCGAAILNEGLYEYEHKGDHTGTVALTLLRSTGTVAWYKDKSLISEEWISPEAQCLGENTAHFGFCPFAGTVENSGIFGEAEMFTAPPLTHSSPVDTRKLLSGRPFVQSADVGGCIFYRQPNNPDKKLPAALQTLKLSGDGGRIVVTASKKAENGCSRIVRLFNTSESEIEFTVFVDKRLRNIAKLSPDERMVLEPSIPFDGRKIRLTARGKEIITLEIK